MDRESDGLQSMGSQKARHELATKPPPPHSTGNSFQCSIMTYTGLKSKTEWIYVYVSLIHLAVYLKLTQHWKSTTLQ